ncbi:MAG: flagellar motor switch protein FliG [Candidatus Marinimicrobia bacterium]|jgi:flagellar motor switch protein FliG|nr:flagellar motor switch protein FliG [Candidatus Neomarinimicrobiota bacterium]MBT3633708.1 flagellar motor switch protein FliG [Candidatus Neomarinimicrobiota bacterium]MBT3682339.1 flagellar motor switch protein FliG [Candidatus Neomarinimicrobiota bacterium]MBT3759103.1 flagellar motor switch protein FliG [Candidatus Neomarinimicrobiota bacterium]MBT3895624.1 flagellar motor switch protein FliG [Candidatus Neomarinimicrobiota bacterium]
MPKNDQDPGKQLSPASFDPIQKAGILCIVIGVQNATNIFKNLHDKEVEDLSIAIAQLRNIPSDIVEEVISEFYEMMLARKYVAEGGLHYAKKILEKTWGLKKAEEVLKHVEAATEVSAFSLLQTVDDKQLLNFLQNEHPQTSALIMANLKPTQSAGLLSQMGEDIQSEIAYRLATMDKTSPELISQIDDVLRFQIGDIFGGDLSKSGGADSVAEILNSASRAAEKNILSNIRERDEALASEIKSLMFLFEDIFSLTNNAIQKIVQNIDTQTLALAMKGSSMNMRDSLYKNMSERASALLKDELEFLGTVRARDVENAQQKILEAVDNLLDAGEIVLARGEEEAVIE